LPVVKARPAAPVEAPAPAGDGLQAAPGDGLPEDLTARLAHFKKTAPAEDARFAIRIGVAMSDDLRARWLALAEAAPTMPRADVYRRLTLLQGEWRRGRRADERIDLLMSQWRGDYRAGYYLAGAVEASDVDGVDGDIDTTVDDMNVLDVDPYAGEDLYT